MNLEKAIKLEETNKSEFVDLMKSRNEKQKKFAKEIKEKHNQAKASLCKERLTKAKNRPKDKYKNPMVLKQV